MGLIMTLAVILALGENAVKYCAIRWDCIYLPVGKSALFHSRNRWHDKDDLFYKTGRILIWR